MDALNGVVSQPTVALDVYNQVQSTQVKPTDSVLSLGEDTLELSPEAVEAGRVERAVKRSTEQMRLRGLNDEEIAAYRDVLEDYKASGKDAKSFLKSLDYDTRDLVKRANSYGTHFSDADVDSWSDEGAQNMLREQDWRFAIDLNGDDMIDHGAGKSFAFPPPNTPETVKDAWEIMSKDMSFKEKMLFTFRFVPIKIEGYPDATTIRGYNLSKQGFPRTEEGWMDLLDKVYETSEWSSRTNPHGPSREYAKKMMEDVTEFKRIINELSGK